MDPHTNNDERSSMYQVEEEEEEDNNSTSETSTSPTEDCEDVETVKTATAASSEDKKDSFLNLLDASIPVSKCHTLENDDDDDDTTAEDNEDDEDIDKYFNDHFPDNNRLDTVEEVTEPVSSCLESLPPDFDMAKIGSSGQPSSDFHPDSLPMEFPSPAKNNNSMTLSVTSREEVYSISEVELFASTWPPKGSASAEISGNQNDGLDDKPLEIGDILLEPKQELSTCSDQPKEQDNSSEENSLSISLPSEGSQNHSNTTTRPAQHLTELRTGILKIFNDAEKVDVDQVDYHQNTSVIHEKYEFESNEKIMSKATNSKSSTAWSSEDRPDDTPFDNDSGIDRDNGAASHGSGKVWSKIHRQLNRRFGGSTGSLSSTSPISDREPKKLTLMEAHSSEGIGRVTDDSVAILKSHIKELVAQLGKSEEDKEKIAEEAYRKAMEIKTEADRKIVDAHSSQMKQVSLIERLKAKVEQYKEQCHAMETRLSEVNQLANQSQIRLNETTHVINSLEDRQKITEDRHFAEVKALQVRLEEQQERNNTLVQVNSTLRDQVEQSESTNQRLRLDLDQLSTQWGHLNQEWTDKQKELSSGTTPDTSHAKVTQLWTDVLDFRRQLIDLKMSTQRDLMTMSSDLNQSGKKMTSACLDVYTRSDTIEINGKATRIGTKEELWTQLQRCRVEKKVLEQKITTLEREAIGHRSKTHSLERSIDEEKYLNTSLKIENESLSKKAKEQEEEIFELQEISAHTNVLENSLQDISFMVSNDEKDIHIDEVDLSIAPHRVRLRSGTPDLKKQGSFGERRRTRSASPAVTESTLSAVQSALQKRHVQIHDLRSRLNNTGFKIGELQNINSKKDELIKALEQQLGKEKREVDSMKIELDKVGREKSNLNERYDTMAQDKSALERGKDRLQEELYVLTKEKDIIDEAHNRLVQELKSARIEIDRLESSNKKLSNENKEKSNFVSNLETESSSLRQELLKTKDELKLVQHQLETAIQEKLKINNSNFESSTTEVGLSSQAEQSKLHLAQKREYELELNLAKLEKSHSNLKSNYQRLETTVQKLNEEKLKLNLEINEHKTTGQSLKDKLVTREHQLKQIESENKLFEEQNKTQEISREKLEKDLRLVSSKKEDLENQFTALTLEKEALHDEVNHVQKEMADLQHQLEKQNAQNAHLNRDKNELLIRFETLTKDIERLERQVGILRADKSQLLAQVDDLNHDLNEADSSISKSKSANAELEKQKENLSKQIKTLKEGFEDEIARLELEKARLEEEKLEIQESMENTIQKLKTELLESEDQAIRERQELKSNFETDHKRKISQLTKDKDEQILLFKKELEITVNNMTQLKQSHVEEILSLEHSKQKNFTIAQQEQKSLKERLEETIHDLTESRDEIEKVRREDNSKMEKDRASIAELQLELSKYQSLLVKKSTEMEEENQNWSINLNKEKQNRINAENEIILLKSTLKVTNDKISELNNEIQTTKEQLEETLDSKKQTLLNMHETEKRLEESKLQNEKLDIIKNNLNETVRDLEVEKANLENDLKNHKTKSRQLEDQLHNANQDLESLRGKCQLIESDNQDLEDQLNYWQSQHQDLSNDHQEMIVQYDNLKTQLIAEDENKQAGNKETQNLRLKLAELESSKMNLEKELANFKLNSEQDQNASRQRISILNQTIEDIRGRERKLEDQRHNLEIGLNHAQQEVKDINIKLHGHDGRLGELYSTIAKLESEKKETEVKLASVASLLHHVRSSSNSRSRPPTPTRVSRSSSSNRRGSSPWPSSTKSVTEVDVDLVKSDIRDLVERISSTMKERDEGLHQVVTLKRQNDDLLEHTVQLEDQVTYQKKRSRTLEEQLKKCELKVSVNDTQLAEQEEKLYQREQELKQLSNRLESTKVQLSTLQALRDGESLNDQQEAKLRQSYESERRQLQNDLNELEGQISRLDVTKRGLADENSRLCKSLDEKDKTIQNLKNKAEKLSRGVTSLEDKCSDLSCTVDNLNSQLEKSLKNEDDLQNKVADLSLNINRTNVRSDETEQKIENLQRALDRTKQEKRTIEDQLEVSQSALRESRQRIFVLEKDLSDAELALQKAESRANHLELSLEANKTSLENNSTDQVVKEELQKVRRENDSLQDKLKDMQRRLTMLDSDKKDLERKIVIMNSKSSSNSNNDQVDHHIRSQIPLLGGRTPTPKGHHAHASGEHLIKIRLLEQENERLGRKVRGLEQQLSELEILHSKRVQDLLQERRKEREKENYRQKEAVKQIEMTHLAREKIFKERIHGLEQQVDVVKDQLNKEMRRRQTFIMESSGISNEISELRQNLDQSLQNVNATTDGRTLDREAGRLNMSVDRYGPDYASRLTPSKLLGSNRATTSTPYQNIESGTKSRRTLHFDET